MNDMPGKGCAVGVVMRKRRELLVCTNGGKKRSLGPEQCRCLVFCSVGGPVISHAVLLAIRAGATDDGSAGSSIQIRLLVQDHWLSKEGLESSKYRCPIRISGPLSTV